MSNNWVVQNLEKALSTWNDKFAEIWNLLTQSPVDFKGGAIWEVIMTIHGSLQAIGLALLVLFFGMGLVKTCSSFVEMKKPEHVFKIFVRFAISKIIVTYGLDLMLAIFDIVQGICSNIMDATTVNMSVNATLPTEIVQAIESCGFFESIPLWAITMLGSIFISVLSILMVLTVYGRFFKLYMYAAISPVPLSTSAAETTQHIAVSFTKSYLAVCLEGAIVLLACIIFSAFASSPPVVDANAEAITQVWQYLLELIFQLLILVGTVKMSDKIVREMLGL